MKATIAVTSLFLLRISVVHAAAAPVTDDLWDVSQGSVVLANSRVHPVSDITHMFGGSSGTIEVDNLLFFDGAPVGFTHFVEWRTSSPATIGQFNLYAAHDASGITERGFSKFELKAFDAATSAFNVVFSYFPTSPYGLVEEDTSLLLSTTIIPVTAQRWRAEFTQAGPASLAAGPRVMELDGFAPVPLPPAGLLLAPALALLAFGRSRIATRADA